MVRRVYRLDVPEVVELSEGGWVTASVYDNFQTMIRANISATYTDLLALGGNVTDEQKAERKQLRKQLAELSRDYFAEQLDLEIANPPKVYKNPEEARKAAADADAELAVMVAQINNPVAAKPLKTPKKSKRKKR